MLTMVIVHAFALISFDSPKTLPWTDKGIVYRTKGKSYKGRMPWKTENLNYSRTMPVIMAKGKL